VDVDRKRISLSMKSEQSSPPKKPATGSGGKSAKGSKPLPGAKPPSAEKPGKETLQGDMKSKLEALKGKFR
jgi:hypothetical protein